MDTILVIEDDKDIAQLIGYHLEKANYKAVFAYNGEMGFDLAKEQHPALIILDLMLPKMDGLGVCRLLKANDDTKHIPIIIVTAKGEEIDKVVGLELGADDYIVKPFSIRELVLRVRAVLRRLFLSEEKTILETDGVVVDIDCHKVMVDLSPIYLTATEFNLLVTLMRQRGKVLTREMLLDKAWGYTFEGYARTVDTHIKRLREKLKKRSYLIETVRGVGYRFKD
jgi:two-component system phosphate regulon response regulator PhoB